MATVDPLVDALVAKVVATAGDVAVLDAHAESKHVPHTIDSDMPSTVSTI